MHIVLHAGVHFTEGDRLAKCLLRNRDDFAQRGVAVPGPGRYRHLLRDALTALETLAPGPDARDVVIDAILDNDASQRVLLSHTNLFGFPRASVRGGMLYGDAPQRVENLARLFVGDTIELFIGLRNPASLLPAALEESPFEEMPALIGNIDPRILRWSDMLKALRAAAPDIPVTVWCNEDAPFIWAQIIREMAGLELDRKITGGFDLLSDIMSREGMTRFRAYLKSHPTISELQKRRVIAAFLDKFALEEAMEEELDADGWTEELVEEMTAIYEADIEAIMRIPGVRMIAP